MRGCAIERLEDRRLLSTVFRPVFGYAFANGSVALTIAPAPTAPSAPTVSYAKIGTTALKLTWPAPAAGSVSKYRITYTPGSAGASKTIDLAAPATSITLWNLAPFTLYSINVSAIDSGGHSATTHLLAWTAATTTQKRYLYVFDLPKNKQGFTNLKPQIEVFDVNAGHKWVKNIPLPIGIYAMRGVAACAASGR